MLLLMDRRQMEPGVTVLELAGRITAGSESQELQELVEQLVRQGVRKLVLDVSAVDEVDSAGLGVLVSCAGLLHDTGGELRLARANAHMARQLRLTRLDLLLPLDEDAEQACRHFSL